MRMEAKRATKTILWVALFCLLLGGGFFFRSITPPARMLNGLSEQERFYFDTFLKKTFLFSELSYVLFGHKPFAFVEYAKANDLTVFHRYFNIDLNFRKGMQIFVKRADFFPKNKFILFFTENESGVFIGLINREGFLKTVRENIQDFESLIGQPISPETLLKEFVLGDDLGAINNSDVLLGILLGFGRNNSKLFLTRKQLMESSREVHLSAKKAESIERELCEINKRASRFGMKDPKDPNEDYVFQTFLRTPYIHLPSFIADPYDSETQELKIVYQKDRERIMKISTKPDAVEIICKQLSL